MKSNNSAPFVIRGIELHNAGKFDEALNSFNEAVRINPRDGKAWWQRARALVSQGRQDDAINSYDRAVDELPMTGELWLSKGMLEKERGLHSRAMESFCFFLSLATSMDFKSVEKANFAIKELIAIGAKRINTEAVKMAFSGYKLAENLKKYTESINAFNLALRQGQGIARIWMYLGMSQSCLGMTEDVIASYTKAIEIDGRNAVYLYNRGVSYAKLGRFQEAESDYRKAIELNPQYLEALSNLGNLLNIQRKHEEAVHILDRALALDCDAENPLFNKAMGLDALNKPVEAVRCYELFLKVASPQNQKQINYANERIGAAAGIGGGFQIPMQSPNPGWDIKASAPGVQSPPAKPVSRPSVAADPKLANDWNNKGIDLFNQRFFQEALACFDKAIELNPAAHMPLFNRAMVLADLERVDEALACYTAILAMKPDVYPAWVNKGAALTDLKRYEEAAECYKKAAELKPDEDIPWFNLATVTKNLGKYDEAVRYFDMAIKINPKHTGALNNKGTALHAAGDLFGAIGCYDQIIAMDPKHAFAWNNKGEVLNILKRYAQALPCFDGALKIRQFAAPWCGKGESLKGLGRFVEAKGCFAKAIEIFPRYAEAFAGKGFCEEKLCTLKDAEASYRQALYFAKPDEEGVKKEAAERLLSYGVKPEELEEIAKKGAEAGKPKPKARLPKGTGEFIGQKYELYRKLGEGGFGIVYHVYSHDTGGVYALKTFRDEYMLDAQTRDLFKKEAQVLVDMESHPYLVEDYFLDEISGRLYIAMEYVAPDDEGLNTLEGYLSRRPPDLIQSLKWGIQFCMGMEFVYGQGLKSHRDIKPANIMITQTRDVKISDFGLAGMLENIQIVPAAGGANSSFDAGAMQTMKGSSMGTPTHMPPEQWRSAADCDEQSDVYSFGVVLYQMATRGAVPFMAKLPLSGSQEEFERFWDEMRKLHESAELKPVDTPLFPVIKKSMAKMPHERYKGFAALRADLEKILLEKTGEVMRPPAREEMNAAEWLNKGLSLKNLGRIEEAIGCYDKCIELKPAPVTLSNAWSNKGNCYMNAGRFEEAMKCYDTALESDRGNVKALCNKGYLLIQIGKSKEALEFYDRALAIEPDYSLAWGNKSLAYVNLKDYEKAIICCDSAIRCDARNEVAWTNKGVALTSLGRNAEALKCYTKALDINPNEPVTLFNVGLCLNDLGKHAEALQFFGKCVSINPKYTAAWVNRGSSFMALKDYAEALKSINTAIETNPNFALSYYYKAYVMMYMKNSAEARKCFNEFIRLTPQGQRVEQVADARARLTILR